MSHCSVRAWWDSRVRAHDTEEDNGQRGKKSPGKGYREVIKISATLQF